MSRFFRRTGCGILSTAVAGALFFGLASAQEIGKKAPEFVLNDLSGKPVKLSDFAGKVVLLDFWATWCRPCIMELPHLKELYKTYKDSGLVIVGVAFQSGSARDIAKSAQKHGLTYPLLMGDDKVDKAYGGIVGFPTKFLIDRKGVLAKKFFGSRSKSQIEAEIKKLL